MKHLGFIMILSLAFCTARAADATGEASPAPAPLEKVVPSGLFEKMLYLEAERGVFMVGIEYANFHYKEPDPNITEVTNFSGVYFSFTKRAPANPLIFSVEADLGGGHSNYSGHTTGGAPLQTSGTDGLLDVRGLMYIPLTGEGGTSRLLPYVGLAARGLTDKQTGYGTYERDISYLYAPVGVKWQTRVSDDSFFGIWAEYEIFLEGKVESHLSDIDPSLPDVTNNQKNGSGYRVGAEFATRLGELNVNFQPFYQVWNIGDSDVQVTDDVQSQEPKNTSGTFGLNLLVLF